MATNFPASLDTLTNPTSSDSLSSPSHSAQHANVNDAVEALQAKVGVDSSAVTSSLDYKVAQLEADPLGIVASVTNSADVSLSTSSAIINTHTFTTISGRKYLALASCIIDNVNTGMIVIGRIEQDGSAINTIQHVCDATYDRINTTMFAVFTGTGASEVIQHELQLSTGAATAEGTTFPSQFVIYDMGE